MTAPEVCLQPLKPDAYGQTTINRVVLTTATQMACLWVDGALTPAQLRSFVRKLRRGKQRMVRLGEPILAIHYINAGDGWPCDSVSKPASIFNCLPDDKWPLLASKPQAVDGHPLLNQPPGTLMFQCKLSAGMPVVIRYDAIAFIYQVDKDVVVLMKPDPTPGWVGCIAIHLADPMDGPCLVDELRAGLVRRISVGFQIEAVEVLPKIERCKGGEECLPCEEDADFDMDLGADGLWRKALRVHPESMWETTQRYMIPREHLTAQHEVLLPVRERIAEQDGRANQPTQTISQSNPHGQPAQSALPIRQQRPPFFNRVLVPTSFAPKPKPKASAGNNNSVTPVRAEAVR